MWTRFGFDFLAASILALTAILGACTPLYLVRQDKLKGGSGRSFTFIIGNMFSAGVMVSAGFCHLLGEAVRDMPYMHFPITPFLCGCGYLLTLCADKAATILSGNTTSPDGNSLEIAAAVDLAERGTPLHRSHHRSAEKEKDMLYNDNDRDRTYLQLEERIPLKHQNRPGSLSRTNSMSEAIPPGSEDVMVDHDAATHERNPYRRDGVAGHGAVHNSTNNYHITSAAGRMRPFETDTVQGGSSPHRHQDQSMSHHSGSSSGAAGSNGITTAGDGMDLRYPGTPQQTPHHHHHHSGHLDAHSSARVSFITAVLMGVALCFHSLLEGAAMGAQETISNSLHIFIAIVSHKGLAAYALGSSIVESNVEYVCIDYYALLRW